tara:strand:+ start:155 stop:352 length:198 start_codon:yes stop_codon:yes gene_type:complete
MKVGDLVRSKPSVRRDAFSPNGKIGVLVEIYPISESRKDLWGRVYFTSGSLKVASYPLAVLEKVE